MIKKYPFQYLPFFLIAAILVIIVSCKKDNNSNTGSTTTNGSTTELNTTATPLKLGLYESDSSIYKLLYMGVLQVGTTNLNDALIYDTGSGGVVLDASGLVPASMITSTGFNFTGDSTVVNGITITSEQANIQYGDDSNSITTVYGNLAYASVTLGDATDGKVVIKRLPFFLYYKGVDSKGNKLPAHYFDIMGVSPQYDITFSNGAYITSPFSYYVPGTGLAKGFKMAALGTSNFSLNGTYVTGVVTLGLTASDISVASSGFTFSPLISSSGNGYIPYAKGTITYKNNKTTTGYVLFDTGTEPYSVIEDTGATGSSQLATGSAVSVTLVSGFVYNYTTTATENLTIVENPGTTGGTINIMCLEYFLTGEYMINFDAQAMGLKNN